MRNTDWKRVSRDEPCAYTCPDIDEAIAIIKHVAGLQHEGATFEPSDLNLWPVGTLIEFAGAFIAEDWDGYVDNLESLRKDNDALRTWGKELAEAIDKAEYDCNYLEGELKESEERVSDLESQVKDLETELAQTAEASAVQIDSMQDEIDAMREEFEKLLAQLGK